MSPTDGDRERARNILNDPRFPGLIVPIDMPRTGTFTVMTTAGDGGRQAAIELIAAALAEARRVALEEAARLVDHHPFADDATEGCIDAQGCCEMMAAQIRALAAPDQGTT